MVIKDIEVTVLKIAKKEGTSKKGQYKFYVCVFVDDEGLVQNATVANDLVSTTGEDKLTSLVVVKADIDLRVSPSGFSTRLEIVDIKL